MFTGATEHLTERQIRRVTQVHEVGEQIGHRCGDQVIFAVQSCTAGECFNGSSGRRDSGTIVAILQQPDTDQPVNVSNFQQFRR